MINNKGVVITMINCACCKRPADKIPEVIYQANCEDMSVEEYVKGDGTYSKTFDTFVCDDCYIKAGSPALKATEVDNLEKKSIYIINECRRILNK